MAGRGRRQDAGCEAPGDEGGNDQEAPVQAHVDAEDASEAEVFVHVAIQDAPSGDWAQLEDDRYAIGRLHLEDGVGKMQP